MTPRTQSLLARFLSEAPGRTIVTPSVGDRVECVLSWSKTGHITEVGATADEAIEKALESWAGSVQRMRSSVRQMLAVCGVESRS